ncbi:hypothetical protein ACFYZJ_24515 [Streptomyces sp. NPDC001848]
MLLHTDPVDGKYPDAQSFRSSRIVTLLLSVGVRFELPVDTLLDGD